ncbi:MAG: GTPase Era [Gammaproteobacteria bacterium]|nr:GTPase Era [Gammaproteobacteria bacterium]NIR85697.1 GTPase Era [Gammaproteobacteria bacterium]NIR90230.1 GTPase Era [Gammaproteobacteria bacterium]NIU06831.1 GTPase Era [Gammaproteobacteria bacterium]NIV53764.1 GTPase Era [Gammaproteobacteria bacterium]
MRARSGSFRCGYVAIVGRPNVGKSTLLNRILGQKLSITSPKPQTTRYRIIGIKTTEAFQAIYVDTPGLHARGRRALNRYLKRAATSALGDVDVIVFVVEALRWTDDDAFVCDKLAALRVPVVLAVNKVDRVKDKRLLLPYLEECARRWDFAELIPISAQRGDNVAELEACVTGRLPPGAAFFPSEQTTDRSERFLVAELVREKLTWYLGDELPHRLSVEIERFTEEDGRVNIAALVWVERESQKAIVIGKGGRMLKRVGTEVRGEAEELLGRRVFLELWVKVKANWSDDERALRQLGYED